MRRLNTILTCAFAIAAGVALVATFSASADANPAAENYRLLNGYRQQHRVPLVRIDPALARAAQKYAEFLATKDGHTADGRTPQQRMKAAGFKGCWFAENVYGYWSAGPMQGSPAAVNLMKAKLAQNWWQNSPGHAANMCNPKYTLVGIGFASAVKAKRRIFKAVQNFGAPC